MQEKQALKGIKPHIWLTPVKDVEFPKTYVQKVTAQSNNAEAVEQYVECSEAVAQYVQCPDPNIYLKQRETQPPGWNIQHLPSSSDHASNLQSSLPSSDSSTAVTSTSARAERATTPKEVIEIEMEDTNEIIEVDSFSAAHLLATQPEILSDTSPDIWHKIIVVSAVYNRMAVLNAINRRISPLKLTPYFFRMEKEHITFLVNNCSAAMTALFKQNLKVPFYPRKIVLKVQLHAKKVDLSAILQRIISNRLSSWKTCLDLSNLTSIPEFQQVMYDPSQTHLLPQLMKMVQEVAPNLISLSLAGNELWTLDHLTSVFANKPKWWSLRVLDLTDNKIDSVSRLVALKSIPITELYLHKNPVCGRYSNGQSYIRVIMRDFPCLTKLDGTYLHCIPGLPQWRPNYIFCSSHGDSGELADQFVEHFFTLYDSEDRACLRGLYHKDAYFSLSSMYLPGQSTSLHARLKSKAALCHGDEKVLAKLQKLPQTRHDVYSFTVDLLQHSDVSTILTVTGVFKEQSMKKNISLRHFMRTFVLIRRANDEYQIVNDIMYVTNATTAEAELAFKYTKPYTNPKIIRPQRHVTESEKNTMTKIYMTLTDMRSEWSRKCLDAVGWDLIEALQTFTEMYKVGKIPAAGFINQKTAEL
ncbi:nuclear RNA export factor 1-like isoform X2 [Schistocerca gregaria]|uniref:nuclear RNA export factor 1-like isoform X2 n=1 Tax=Schistocerca gregaria TaxID=7010 RepID=UPI00211F2C8C|nr:nuclear RNA export factor 1-like isoform X2 [Schistocerca gregaria]